jgi:hypothetical protein
VTWTRPPAASDVSISSAAASRDTPSCRSASRARGDLEHAPPGAGALARRRLRRTRRLPDARALRGPRSERPPAQILRLRAVVEREHPRAQRRRLVRKRADPFDTSRSARIAEARRIDRPEPEGLPREIAAEERIARARRIDDPLHAIGRHAPTSGVVADERACGPVGDHHARSAVLLPNPPRELAQIGHVREQLPRRGGGRLQQIGRAQHLLEGRPVPERRERVARQDVEIDDGREALRVGELEGGEGRVEGQLGDLGRESAGAGDEVGVVAPDVLGAGLGGGTRGHVDRTLALGVDEDLGEGRRATRQVEARRDAVGRHRAAQAAPRVVVGLAPEDPDRHAEERRPAELVQHQPADPDLDRARPRRRLEQPLLVGGEHTTRAVHAVEDHAADADELERVAPARPAARRRLRAPTHPGLLFSARTRHAFLRTKRVTQGSPISRTAIAWTAA